MEEDFDVSGDHYLLVMQHYTLAMARVIVGLYMLAWCYL
jgi:hypothetical protein